MIEEELRKRICRKCDFYKEDETLECYAFKLSKKLIKEGKLRLDEL
jgi:predicted HTH domain antitoxin